MNSEKGKPFRERRKHPRSEGNIPVKICSDEFDLVTETKNLSRSGVYCRVNRSIDLMTKLKMQLLLSFKKKQKTVTKKISCEGVVVRVDPGSEEEGYNIAIYFQEIKPKDADWIAEYVNHSSRTNS